MITFVIDAGPKRKENDKGCWLCCLFQNQKNKYRKRPGFTCRTCEKHVHEEGAYEGCCVECQKKAEGVAAQA